MFHYVCVKGVSRFLTLAMELPTLHGDLPAMCVFLFMLKRTQPSRDLVKMRKALKNAHPESLMPIFSPRIFNAELAMIFNTKNSRKKTELKQMESKIKQNVIIKPFEP